MRRHFGLYDRLVVNELLVQTAASHILVAKSLSSWSCLVRAVCDCVCGSVAYIALRNLVKGSWVVNSFFRA